MGKDTTKVMSSNGGEIKEVRDESSISYEDQMVGGGTVTSSKNNTAGKTITILNNATKKTVTIAPLPFNL